MFWLPMESMTAETYDTYDIASALTYLNLRIVPWAHKRFFQDLPQKGGKILEIGSSTGEFLKKAQETGYTATGIDSARKTAEFAHSYFGLENIYPFTIQELIAQKPDEKYDIIAFFQVLEHIDDVPSFVKSVKKLLKPGGFIAISVPNRDRWRFHSERFFMEKWDQPPSHLTRWNISSLVNIFNINGFSVITKEVEPLKFYDSNWSNFISQKLGINGLAETFTRKVVGTPHGSLSTPKENSLRKTMIGFLGRLYLKIFFPLLSFLTLPFGAVVRRQGVTIYLLVQIKNQPEG